MTVIKRLGLLATLTLTVLLLATGCGNEFERKDVDVVAYRVTVRPGDYMDGVIGTFYEQNEIFVSWADYRQKHYDINARLTNNGRFLQPGDVVTVYVLKKKGK